MEIAGLYILAYLVGAIPTAYLVGKLVKGIDIRRYGSGNVGGANIFHHVGKGWVVPLVLFEVFVKGATPIWIGQHLLALEPSSTTLVVAALLAVVGNNWSVYLKFQGGRGITVAGGTLLALAPLLLGGFILVALVGWLVTRSPGVWWLISLALLPVWAALTNQPTVIVWYCAGLLALVVLKRLLANWTALPDGLPRKRVLINRLLRDRDVDDRGAWVGRAPQDTER